MGREMGESFRREVMYVYLWLIHVEVWQKATKFCKAITFQFSSVTQSCLTLQLHGLQHARLPCPSPTPGAHSNSCPLSRWCHPTISSSVIPFSSHLQFFPALGSFLMNWLFASGGQSIGASASTSVVPMYIQDWFPLELTGWISLQSRGLSRVFSNTTVKRHVICKYFLPFSRLFSFWFHSLCRSF